MVSIRLNRLRINFNSIKVQLELVNLHRRLVVNRFQFHKGTIRTNASYLKKLGGY